MRCKVCDRVYHLDFLAKFPDENYCPVCEEVISVCIFEMEEEKEDEAAPT